MATLYVFILAMVLHPEIQGKAQKEIDAIVGKDRLPQLNDRKNLPYVQSVLAEVFRWAPALPLCRPQHFNSENYSHSGKAYHTSWQRTMFTTTTPSLKELYSYPTYGPYGHFISRVINDNL